MQALRWGILSTASINSTVLESCRKSVRNRFVAVASRDAEKAKRYAAAHGILRAIPSYEDLLNESEIDAVYISLPNAFHMKWVFAALTAGKHVFCEKPLGRNHFEIAAAYDEAERRGLVFAEAFMFRHHRQTELLTDLVCGGSLGQPRAMTSFHSFQMPIEEYQQRLSPDLDGGALMDLGCYQVSMSRLLLGEPEMVDGYQYKHQNQVDLRFSGSLYCQNGAVSQFYCAMDLPLRNGLMIVGTEATVVVDDPWHCRTDSIVIQKNGQSRRLKFATEDPYLLEFEAFARAASGEKIKAFARQDAQNQALVISSLYDSANAKCLPACSTDF